MAHPNVPVEAGVAVLVAGAFVKVLPPLAAALAVVWYAILIWQSHTGKLWRARWSRVFRRKMTAEDRVAFVVLGLGGTGVFLAMLGIGSLIQ